MEKERERAADMGYPSPIHPDKVSTDKDFNEGVGFCIEHLDNVSLIVASHNESRVIVKIDDKWKVVHVHKSPAWQAPHIDSAWD